MEKREQEALLQAIKNQAELFWENPEMRPFLQAEQTVDPALIEDAARRLERFAPFLAKAFPETAAQHGIIESALREIPEMGQSLSCPGKLMLKMDSHLPISGSVKARGGIYEVLRHAEDLAVQAGKLQMEDDYAVLAEPEFRAFFEQFCVQVGSTGNLGMSIGIMSAALGFQTIVHMSADAKEWKKQLLRQHGVQVLEYAGDYSQAVAQGRKNSDADPRSYFVDDEHSLDLFLGYAVAAQRLKAQLEAQEIQISRERPLFVYLPCGVGGAPGGICYGLKQIFGDAVSCFFVEPAATPCMLLGLATGKMEQADIRDYGLSGKTHADGLAVGRPSGLVCRAVRQLVSGIFTVRDAQLYDDLRLLGQTEHILLEPSACASFAGPRRIGQTPFAEQAGRAVHIAWATGGSMVPEEVMEQYLHTFL